MSIYEQVTIRILEELEKGVVPWRKTWAIGLPKNLGTNKEYRGINILVLGMAGFNSCHWLSYRQALNLGGHVRKGERGTPIVYWHWRTERDLQKLRNETGKEDFNPCVPLVSTVFNLDQIEGVSLPREAGVVNPPRQLELAENLFDTMPNPPQIVHSVAGEPSYSCQMDRITLPHLSQFESAEEYYSTLFHELTHATGHVTRLNRFTTEAWPRVEQYSFEELVAEFGAAFLCAFAGINNAETEALSASYIHHWSEAFRDDSRLLLRAAGAAQHAADYIRGGGNLPTGGTCSG